MAYHQNTIHVLYKKLLALYPQGFREQFAESMEQTFNDVCNERIRTGQGSFGLMTWMFFETGIGIAQEHISSIKEMKMKNTLIDLRSPAVAGFLLILPFILLEAVFVEIKSLSFDMRDALDSVVIFGFLWLGITTALLILMPVLRILRIGNKSAANPAPDQENNLFLRPTMTTITSLLMALPFVALLSMFFLHIEPPIPELNSMHPAISLFIVLGVLLLAVAACFVARAPIVRTMQSGGSLLAYPVNLAIIVIVVGFILMLVGGLVIDQFPCWIGVPNCD